MADIDILINGGIVVTVDKNRRIIKDGAVAIKGNKILDIGKKGDLKGKYSVDRVIDASKKLILPGLISGHTHPLQHLAKGLGDDADVTVWVHDRIMHYEANLTPEDAYTTAMLCCIESIKTGTTFITDPGSSTLAVAAVQALVDSGIRATTAAAVSDIDDPRKKNQPVLMSDVKKAVKTTEDLYNKFHNAGNGRIRVWSSVRQDILATDELIRAQNDFALKHKTGFRTHAAISKDQLDLIKERHGGKGAIEWFDSMGVLGPHWLLIHMGWINDHEVQLLKKYDVKVAHCISATLHSAYGSCIDGKFPELVKAGVTVTVGPDSAAVSNYLDMFREMFHFAGIYKELRRNANLITPEQALEAGTIMGARANLQEDEVGSLEKGKKADVIIVDIDSWGWTPMHDFSIVPNIIYCGDGHDVNTVIIDGKIVMRNRVIRTVDEEEWVEKGQQVAAKVVEKSGLNKKIKPRWPII